MTQAETTWTGNIDLSSDLDVLFNKLCDAFNGSPFYAYCGMQMRVVDGQIEAFVHMKNDLIGNVAYQILHGGVAATILDSIGGITAMGELYKKAKPEELEETSKKVSRLATVDMRVDYLAPGRGQYFTARAETLRLGRKGCTMRMTLINDEGKSIATAIASYAY
ncbi:hypothetical protein A3K93_02765 [Acinetobacter sp. NCu2D-2]|uniref:thioesterase family protein n=1 Tax=Acinetobacter sp. NCu2D-2 TaxID=1608473 RepID=UPI0007CDE730|nr:thioesterase family protein [Acinetobacter sp. NCu2D-2]ANF81223.1 hypothetical protein A3K93_02765 [Acinetobacter sp. NCu2D-2]